MKKFIGKPYAGKLHVRFDEGDKCNIQTCGNEPALITGGLTKQEKTITFGSTLLAIYEL